MDAKKPGPNPRRVAAGKRNYQLRKGLTDEGRRVLQQTALRHEPWRYSTGPTSAQGKAVAAANGKTRQLGPQSVREVRATVAECRALLSQMREARDIELPPPPQL